ncbi:MAG: extracellular solute-binding protein [Clostridia bacterium]|nr:extracellular solute-binding protein [Clostridia bacterium]
MKKILTLMVSLALMLGAAGAALAENTELIVFAAASMTETLNAIKALYKEVAPEVALAVPEGNPAGIQSYDDLAARLAAGDVLLAMGNSDVPVGQYTQKILAYYHLNEEDLAAAGAVTYGSNVKEVTSQVAEAAVDCGVIYATDAFSAGLDVVDTATADMCGQVVYPAAVLNITRNEAAARAFLDYLTGPEASAVFEAVGFSPLSK